MTTLRIGTGGGVSLGPLNVGNGAGVALSGGGGFVGAYDTIPSIVAAYGMRRLRATYTGDLVRLRRSSDNAEQDFGYTSTGALDTAAIATFVGGGSGFIVTWYDQSGSGYNATQSTAANQPLYVASGQNSKPVARFDGSNDSLAATIIAYSQPLTFAAVARRASGLNGRVIDTRTARVLFGLGPSSNAYDQFAGTLLSGGTPGTTWHVLTAQFNSASSFLRSDGASALSGNAGTNATGTTMYMGFDGSAAWSAVDIAEIVMANVAWNATQYQAAEAAANQYWGVF